MRTIVLLEKAVFGGVLEMKQVWQEEKIEDLVKKAYKIYNDSVDKPITTQKRYVAELKKLYEICDSDEIADCYAMALFNLSLLESVTKMYEIAKTLWKLYESKKTCDIAICNARILYNLSASKKLSVAEMVRYATKIEELYLSFPQEDLAEPLAKIWCNLSQRKIKKSSEYAKKVVSLCSKISAPKANEAYANVLFNSKDYIENREQLINSFLSGTQTLTSFGYYLESVYYPKHNAALEDFELYSSYPVEILGKKINTYLKKLRNHPSYIDLKVELLAVLFYTLEIKRHLVVPQNAETIGHYTKLEKLKYLVSPPKEDGLLRMYNAAYMNDPSEGFTLSQFLCKEDNEIFNSKFYQATNIYLSCFTLAVDQLPMWSMYGADGTGCCLILRNKFFDYSPAEYTDELILDPNCNFESNFLYRVCYLSSTAKTFSIATEIFSHDIPNLEDILSESIRWLEKHIGKILEFKHENPEKLIDDILAFILEQIVFLFKDMSYSHERELRLIRYSEEPKLDEDSFIVPQLYVEVKKSLEFKKIILGPKVTQSNRIIPYLFYTDKVKLIEKSKIEYR